MLNRVILIGRLGKDPEVRTFDGGTMLVRLTLATNESYKDRTSGEWKENTEWHNLVFWRDQAERAERQLKKGALVYVEGKLQYREWSDQDGHKRITAEINVHSFRIVANSKEHSEMGEHAEAEHSEPTTQPVIPKAPMPVQNPDDDLPF